METNHAIFSGSVPANYDRFMGPFLFEPYALDICSRIKTDGLTKVLETACGTGRVTKHLRETLPGAVEFIATDLNPGMIEIAKQVTNDKNTRFEPADAQELPYADNSFELVVCQFGFMFVPDKPKAFAEAYRVLKPGGCLLFNTWDKIENNLILSIAKNITDDFFSDNPPSFFKVPFSMHDTDELSRLVSDAGFSSHKISLVTCKGVSETAMAATKGMITGSPIYKEIIDKDPNAIEEILIRTEAAIVKLCGDHPATCDLNAFVTEAWK